MREGALLNDWYERFGIRDQDLATVPEIFPYMLDSEADPPADDVVAHIVLASALTEQESGLTLPEAFRLYLEQGELEAARRVLELIQGRDEDNAGEALDGPALAGLREELDRQRSILQLTYQRRMAEWLQWDPQLAPLGLLSRLDRERIENLVEEAERLYQRTRFGPALAVLDELLKLVEPLVEEARAQITDRLQNLQLRMKQPECPAPAAGAYFCNLIEEYLHNNDLRLAREYLDRAELAVEGRYEPDPLDVDLAPYRDPGPFPAVDLKAVNDWIQGRQPQVVNHSEWDTFLQKWALPSLPEAARSARDDELGAVVEAIHALLQTRDSKVVIKSRKSISSPWRIFFRNFVASLGVPANYVTEPIQALKGANEELFGTTELRQISCMGSFLDTEFLQQRLLLVACRDPLNPQHPFPSLAQHLRTNNLTDRVGVVFTPYRVPPLRIRAFLATAPRCAVLDEGAILKILMAPTAEARKSRFVAHVASQLEPQVVNPFRPHGPVHSTMFFGRQSELDQLLSPAGPAILYGGRRLGKSSILGALSRRFEAINKQERVAVYLPVTNAGTNPGTIQFMLQELWDALLRRLRDMQHLRLNPAVLDPGDLTPAEFRQRLARVLDDNPRLHLLLLLDEADALVEALTFPERFGQGSPRDLEEARLGTELRDLVQRYGGRLQVILAGFQQIYRAATHPKSPFFNFRGAEPLPIGTLSTQDAYNLVVRSLSLLGLQFPNRVPIDLILLYTSCHPSLLQAFCEQLFYRARKKRRNLIDTNDVDAVFRDRSFRRQMFDVIHMNVEDDPRNSRERRLMRMVLYAWLHQEGSLSDLGQRLVVYPDEIYQRLCAMLGEQATKSVLRVADVAEYLNDLKVLGVLQRTRDDGYFLVNPHFPDLLRQFRDTNLQEEIERIWLNLHEPVQRVRSRVARQKDPGGWTLAPITAEDEDRIDEAVKRGVVCILGSSRMGKTLVLDWLQRRMSTTQANSARVIRLEWQDLTLQKAMRKLARKLGVSAKPEAITERLVTLAEQATTEDPVWLILEDVDQAASSDEWRRWEHEGVLAPITDALNTLANRGQGGRIWAMMTGSVGLARTWHCWPEYMDTHAVPIYLRRFQPENRDEREAWVQANLEDVAFSESAREMLWQRTMGDPRLLEGFVVWARPLIKERKSLTETHVRNYLDLLNPDTPALWPEPVRKALAEMPVRLRAGVALAYAWEEHWNQDSGAGIVQGELELAWNDEAERARLLSWLSDEHRAVLESLTAEELAVDLRVLAALDELKEEPAHRPVAGPNIVLARVRPGDPWAMLVCGYQEARR